MQFTAPLVLRVQSYNVTPSTNVDCSLPIAETTIVAGARYLTLARDIVQERYSDVATFVYGDTDSLFLKTVERLSVTDAIKYIPPGY
jgi:hypothetical protein